MKKAHALKWIKALRSGKYKQTTGVLRSDQGYCCLGVLDQIFPKLNLASGDLECLVNYRKIGLSSSSGNLIGGGCLAQLNDGTSSASILTKGTATHEQLNFDEIADVIQIEYVEGL